VPLLLLTIAAIGIEQVGIQKVSA